MKHDPSVPIESLAEAIEGHSSVDGARTLTQQKRLAILEAALREFEAHGFDQTSMDRIASSAGVSKRTVYNHFASKSALFDAIIAELSDKVAEVTECPYAREVPLRDQLELIGHQVIAMLTAPCTIALARVALAEMLRSPNVAGSAYDLIRARQTGLSDWLRDAHGDGRLVVPDPLWAADQFMGQLKAFAFWPHMVGGQAVPDDVERARIVGRTVDMMLNQYGRGSPADGLQATNPPH
jgi:TetR/AcrR family transcriptional regulator of autoinduction and epiphytic fitness